MIGAQERGLCIDATEVDPAQPSIQEQSFGTTVTDSDMIMIKVDVAFGCPTFRGYGVNSWYGGSVLTAYTAP
jgi:hypothetical protein